MIVFDLQAIQSAAHGERGIARYVGDIAEALDRDHPGLVDVFAWNDALAFEGRITRLDVGDRLRRFGEIRGANADILHVNSPFELLSTEVFSVPVRAERTVVTCYDLIPQRFPNVYLTDPALKAHYQARLGLLISADHIVTDSESAARDVASMLDYPSAQLTSLGAGVSNIFVPPVAPYAERIALLRNAIPTLRPGFILVPTGMDWRKNTDGALHAYSMLDESLRRRHQLVVACRMNEAQLEEMRELCARLGIDGQVVVTGFVIDDDLVRLYQSAELVFFPSFYEGFGLPVLEARRCGARVICSNVSSLPEVLPDTVATFNPYDVPGMADRLRLALTDINVATALDAAADSGFTWELAATRLAAVYRGLLDAGADAGSLKVGDGQTHRSKPRVAVATLLPPTMSGIADHSVALLSELQQIAEVTAFVQHDVTSNPGRWTFDVEGLRTLPSRWAAGEFDHVVYCFGNNDMHSPFVSMMERVPGWAFLHDVRLDGCVEGAERTGMWFRDADDLDIGGGRDRDGNDLIIGTGVRSVCRRAVGVLVQSVHAAALVETVTGVRSIDIGPLPHFVRVGDELAAPDNPLARASPDGDARLTVISAGIADNSKQSGKVAEAFGIVTSSRSDVRCVLVGPGGERWAEPLSNDVAVGATGPVPAEEFGEWLAASAVAVQLRGQTNGESSGAVADLLSRGVPTIVTDLGAMGELDGSIVVKVPVDISASTLAGAILELLDDPERRIEMHDRSVAYARKSSYAAQASALLDAVTAVRPI